PEHVQVPVVRRCVRHPAAPGRGGVVSTDRSTISFGPGAYALGLAITVLAFGIFLLGPWLVVAGEMGVSMNLSIGLFAIGLAALASVLVGLPGAIGLSRLLRRARRQWLHVLAFVGLGLIVGLIAIGMLG